MYNLRLPLLIQKNSTTSATQPSNTSTRPSRFCSWRRQAGTSHGNTNTSGSQYCGMTLVKKYQKGSR
ncbi:hypothetical protein D3C84_1042830 [compost metagenome]